MPVAFAIVIDSDASAANGYLPGSWISGRVILTLRKPQKTRGLRLTFKAYENTHWTTGSGKHRKTHSQTIDIFSHELILFGYRRDYPIPDNEVPELPAGSSIYPFRIQIPNAFLPASIELPSGRVRYEMFAYIDIIRWFDTFSPTYLITVRNSLIVNTPNLIQPISVVQEQVMGCFTKQGVISCFSSIDKQGYLPGETIVINSQITNSSTKSTISSVEGSLKLHIEYMAHNSRNRVMGYLANMVIQEPILPQSPTRSLQHMITIPRDILYLSKRDSRLITISHFVKIKLHIGGCGNKIEVRLPIVIGNTVVTNQPTQDMPSVFNNEQLPVLPPFQYAVGEAQNPSTLDVELPPYQDIVGTESY